MINRDELVNALRSGIVEVNFTKVNGEVRTMKSTLKEDLLPQQIDLEESISKKKNDNVIAIWEVDLKSWRSFRIDSVNEWKPI
jgi:hypothetical protein